MRKSMLTFSIIPLLAVLLITGCKRDNSITPPQPQPPGVEDPGDGFVQANIDGKTIAIEEAADQLSGTVFGKIEGVNNNVLTILAHADVTNNNYRQISLVLKDDHSIKEGTYDVIYREIPGNAGIGGQYQGGQFWDRLSLTVQWKNEKGRTESGFLSLSAEQPYPEAKVTITKFTDKKGEYIEGTFYVKDGIDGLKSKPVSLTDGKFSVRLD